VRVDLGTEQVALGPSDVDLVQESVEGWGVASDGGITVALELELTPELRAEGLARELVRAVQDARKAAGLDVGDRIVLGLRVEGGSAAEALHTAIDAHRPWIAGETLAVEIVGGTAPDATFEQTFEIEGARVAVTLRRA
jgi:isoleucyl-tRNA synthetase